MHDSNLIAFHVNSNTTSTSYLLIKEGDKKGKALLAVSSRITNEAQPQWLITRKRSDRIQAEQTFLVSLKMDFVLFAQFA